MAEKRESCEDCVYNQKWFCVIMGDYVKRSGHCSEYEKKKKGWYKYGNNVVGKPIKR